jgi:hypothetical protein
MNKLVALIAVLTVCSPAFSAMPAGRGRAGMATSSNMRAAAS